MSDLNFSGFYYIEGDTTNGYIDKALSYDDNLANNKTAANITYKDILTKFEVPVILSNSNGLYVSKFIVGENQEKTRTDINPNADLWKCVFSIANYVNNQFYVFAGRTFAQIDGLKMLAYINAVLSRKIQDPKLASTALFERYVDKSIKLFHVDDQISSAYYYRLRNFQFQVVWNGEIHTFDMWVNPEGFVTQWKSANPYIYIYYPVDGDTSTDIVDEVSKHIADKILTHYKKTSIPAMVPRKVGDNINIVEISVPLYIWSTEVIPNNPLKDSMFMKAIQDTIKRNENKLSDTQLAKRYPTVFEESERIIYPLVDNDTINKIAFKNNESKFLVVAPIDVSKINKLIKGQSSLTGLTTFESSTVLVGKSYIPFIAGSVSPSALTDKVPFYRASVAEVEALKGFDEKKIASAKEFVHILSSIIDYQLNGANIEDIRKNEVYAFQETQTYCTVKFLGIIWKIINRKFDVKRIIS